MISRRVHAPQKILTPHCPSCHARWPEVQNGRSYLCDCECACHGVLLNPLGHGKWTHVRDRESGRRFRNREQTPITGTKLVPPALDQTTGPTADRRSGPIRRVGIGQGRGGCGRRFAETRRLTSPVRSVRHGVISSTSPGHRVSNPRLGSVRSAGPIRGVARSRPGPTWTAFSSMDPW